VILGVPVDPPADLRHPQLDPVMLEQRGHRGVLAAVGETDPVLAGIQSRSLQAASIANVPVQAFPVKRSGTKEV
jgi:hypothetical protein